MQTYFEELMFVASELKDKLNDMLIEWKKTIPDPLKHFKEIVHPKVQAGAAFKSNIKTIDKQIMKRYLADQDVHAQGFVSPRSGYTLEHLHGIFHSSILMAEGLEELSVSKYAEGYVEQITLLTNLRMDQTACIPSATFIMFYAVRSLSLQYSKASSDVARDIVRDLRFIAFYLHLIFNLYKMQGFFRETLLFTNSIAHQMMQQARLEDVSLNNPGENEAVHCAIAFATCFLSTSPSVRIFYGREVALSEFWKSFATNMAIRLLDVPIQPVPRMKYYRLMFVNHRPLSTEETAAAEQVESLYIALYDSLLRHRSFYLDNNPSDHFMKLLRKA